MTVRADPSGFNPRYETSEEQLRVIGEDMKTTTIPPDALTLAGFHSRMNVGPQLLHLTALPLNTTAAAICVTDEQVRYRDRVLPRTGSLYTDYANAIKSGHRHTDRYPDLDHIADIRDLIRVVPDGRWLTVLVPDAAGLQTSALTADPSIPEQIIREVVCSGAATEGSCGGLVNVAGNTIVLYPTGDGLRIYPAESVTSSMRSAWRRFAGRLAADVGGRVRSVNPTESSVMLECSGQLLTVRCVHDSDGNLYPSVPDDWNFDHVAGYTAPSGWTVLGPTGSGQVLIQHAVVAVVALVDRDQPLSSH